MTFDTVAAGFLARAGAAPDALAVCDVGGVLSYGEIERLSARLARELLRAAGGARGRVGLVAGQSRGGVVALLAALRAGQCVVPISPHESDGYVASLLDDADTCAVVADAASAELAERVRGAHPLCVAPDDMRALDAAFDEAALPDFEPALGAIIYTSGTTGRPKGVMTLEAAIVERARQYLEVAALAPDCRQASIISWHFSAAFPDVYGALFAGASLHLYDAHALGPDALGAFVKQHSITHLTLPLALLRRLLERATSGELDDVRLVAASGDRLDLAELGALDRLLSGEARFVNVYGCTEANLVAQLVLDGAGRAALLTSGARALPVGRAARDKKLSIVDEADASRAAEGDGEVAIASPLLSPGYWKQPELTGETFRETQAGRIYLTGDLGRLGPDGALELVGRKGAQVKVRGMRVALSAVEALLRELPGVADAVVVARHIASGETQLVAYAVPAPGAALVAGSVQRELRARAPVHWVPARVMVLAALPLLVSGKVDRSALPAPDAARPALPVPYTEPRTPVESSLASLWATELDLDRVGVHDGFADLGGDSLQLATLLARVEDELGVRVPLAAVDGELTVATLAAALAARDDAAAPGTPHAAAAPEKERGRTTLRARARRQLRRRLPELLRKPLAVDAGVRASRLLFRSASVRERWFAEPLDVVRRWHAQLGSREPLAHALRRSLLANTLFDWRRLALQDPRVFARWVRIEIDPTTKELLAKRERGAVLAVAHMGVKHFDLLAHAPLLAGREVAAIRNRGRKNQERSEGRLLLDRAVQLRQARATLERAGLAVIAADGKHGAAGVDHPFFGRVRRFRFGAAQLAVGSNAAFVPVFSRFALDGRVHVDFEAPLETEPGARQDRIVDLTRRYAELFALRWPGFYSSVRWHALPPPGDGS